MSIDLKPCPFCGGEPFLNHYPAHTHKLATWMPDAGDQYAVECCDCGVGHLCEDAESAKTWWNLRYEPTKTEQPVSVDLDKCVLALINGERKRDGSDPLSCLSDAMYPHYYWEKTKDVLEAAGVKYVD